MNKDTFSSYHPIINMLYFTAIIGFGMFFMHPIALGISLLCSITYFVYLKGQRAVRFALVFMLPVLIITASINPLWTHQGATILAYFPNGNPLTLESIAFGLAAAAMLVSIIAWFSCFTEIMTSDKFVYLFGRLIPALSMILAMALRIVPRFKSQLRTIPNAQKCIGRDISNGNLITRAKHGMKIISIMITWALESAIETADSMKNRGYGLPGRTAFSIFRFDRRDLGALIYIVLCAGIVLAGYAMGAYHFRFFPTIAGRWTGFATYLVFAAYLALAVFPLIVNIKEELTWKKLKAEL
jgi:energy-coupling factor transport system permease protein